MSANGQDTLTLWEQLRYPSSLCLSIKTDPVPETSRFNSYFKHGKMDNVQGGISSEMNRLIFGRSFLLHYLKPVHDTYKFKITLQSKEKTC
jgi:hypothetical protein